MQLPPEKDIERIVKTALAEDIGSGDATSLATVPENIRAVAKMVARESLVVCGLVAAEKAFVEVSPDLRVEKIPQTANARKKAKHF